MSDETEKAEVLIVKPHQVAWLRRPELEVVGFQVWELPDGDLYHHDLRQGPLMVQITKRHKPPAKA